MTWYAQHGEDKRLREFFPDKNNGFYIDVGAFHPSLDSVTKHFYDGGWSGINIEPIPDLFKTFLGERTRDMNLEMAVSDSSGIAEINWVGQSGLSTFDDKIAQGHKGFISEKIRVRVETLAWVCNSYVHGREIDFLKIDVEGHESAVLRGMYFEWWRPKILCIEATLPCTDTPCYEEWLPICLAQGYKKLDFDGLNLWLIDDARD